MKPQPTRATQGISFELPILRAAKEHAASRRMSLSAYVNQLIFDDLNCQSATETENTKADYPDQDLRADGRKDGSF